VSVFKGAGECASSVREFARLGLLPIY